MNDDSLLWSELLEAEGAYIAARKRFIKLVRDPISIFRRALDDPRERATALEIIRHYPEELKLVLLEHLLDLALVTHREIGSVREVLMTLPNEAVLASLDQRQEHVLQHGGEEDYRRLLELLEQLNLERCRELALRATSSSDEEVREAGSDFLARIGGSS